MEKMTLGTTQIEVPLLCIGTWAWGDKFFWSYGKDYTSDELHKAFDAAVRSGVNFFDTAEVYGNGLSEKFLGQFIQGTGAQVILATKYGPMPWRIGGQSIAEALTASLNRLQLQHIDLYQVHWPFAFLMSQSTLMNALADEVEKGRIGAVGVSNYTADQMREAHQLLARRGVPLAVNQVRYSLLSRQVETSGIIKTAKELGVTILAYSPLAQGLLTGKYAPESSSKPMGARKIDNRFKPEGLQKIAPVIDLLRTIGDRYQKTPAQVALNWLIAQGNVIPIAGAKNALQVEQNAGALGWKLTEAEVDELDQATLAWK